MTFVKVIKNKAYHKRFQVKFRRRREGKTDYRQRKRLVVQDKNKYLAAKWRFVVRFTNTKVITQITKGEADGDYTICQATSLELPRYGLTVGLTNYAAGYCTGLLCARRLLQKLKMDALYEGNLEVDGNVVSTTDVTDSGRSKKYWVAEVDAERRPFHCVLDVGVRATTTGARVFGALKGAADGGLDIPHSQKRFPGYDREAKEYAPDFHRDRIFGAHVSEYMTMLQEKDEAAYEKQFSRYIKAGISADDLEALYTKVHEAIRADPSAAPKKEFVPDKKYRKQSKRNLKQRKNRVAQKKAWRLHTLMAAAAGDSDSDE